jgi:hypothetical protein
MECSYCFVVPSPRKGEGEGEGLFEVDVYSGDQPLSLVLSPGIRGEATRLPAVKNKFSTFRSSVRDDMPRKFAKKF